MSFKKEFLRIHILQLWQCSNSIHLLRFIESFSYWSDLDATTFIFKEIYGIKSVKNDMGQNLPVPKQ